MHSPRHTTTARLASALIVVAVGALGLSACAGDSSPAPKASSSATADADAAATVDDSATVATVDGHKITGATYNSILTQIHAQAQQQAQQGGQSMSADQEKSQAIDAVVGNELLLLDATAHGYKASKDDVDKQFSQAEKQFDSKDKFADALKQNNLTEKSYRAQISDQLRINAYVDKELGPFEVSDKDVKKVYDQQKQLMEQQQKQQGGDEASAQPIPKLKDVKDQLTQQLQQQKQQQAVSDQVDALKKKAEVKVLI